MEIIIVHILLYIYTDYAFMINLIWGGRERALETNREIERAPEREGESSRERSRNRERALEREREL